MGVALIFFGMRPVAAQSVTPPMGYLYNDLNVARVAIEGACAVAQNADVALKTLQKLVETRHNAKPETVRAVYTLLKLFNYLPI